MPTVREQDRLVAELQKPWYLSLLRDENGWPEPEFVAEAPELAGCVARGKTPGEALARLEQTMEHWFLDALEHGLAIPEPYEWVREPRAR